MIGMKTTGQKDLATVYLNFHSLTEKDIKLNTLQPKEWSCFMLKKLSVFQIPWCLIKDVQRNALVPVITVESDQAPSSPSYDIEEQSSGDSQGTDVLICACHRKFSC